MISVKVIPFFLIKITEVALFYKIITKFCTFLKSYSTNTVLKISLKPYSQTTVLRLILKMAVIKCGFKIIFKTIFGSYGFENMLKTGLLIILEKKNYSCIFC